MNFNWNSHQFDFPKYDGQPRWYCVASSPRTGSSLLCDYLHSSGNAGNPLEYFNDQYISDYLERWNFSNFSQYVRLLQYYRTSSNGFFGIKCHLDQFMKGREYFPEDILFITIYRRNIIRQAVSYFKAFFSGQYSYYENIVNNIDEKFYNFDSMFHFLNICINMNNNWEKYFLSINARRMKISYEDLCAKKKQIFKQIEDFLQIDLENIYAMTPHLKVQSDNLTKYYINLFSQDLKKRNIKILYDDRTNIFRIA